MKKAILITGASSGIGRATALYFGEKGWQVFATMRNPDAFGKHENVIPLVMDVTSKPSIDDCFSRVWQHTIRLDAVVNNAGYGGFGAFELSTGEQRQHMYDVNVFGLMEVTQAVLPHFRQHRSGVIVNISSIGGLMTYPLYSVYHSTKWAVEGFSESLHYELRPFGIKIKLIEPGVTKTHFSDRSLVKFTSLRIRDYDAYTQRLQKKAEETFKDAIPAETVARKIYEAVTDGTDQLRYPVGNRRSVRLWRLRKWLPTAVFIKMIRNFSEK